MKSKYSKLVLVALVTLMSLPAIASAQTSKPRIRRATTPRRVVPLVTVGTNLKVRLEDTLSSKDSRAGDKFTATVLDPVRFNEATTADDPNVGFAHATGRSHRNVAWIRDARLGQQRPQ